MLETSEHVCVTDEELSQLNNNELTVEEARVLLVRINSCPYCKRRFIISS